MHKLKFPKEKTFIANLKFMIFFYNNPLSSIDHDQPKITEQLVRISQFLLRVGPPFTFHFFYIRLASRLAKILYRSWIDRKRIENRSILRKSSGHFALPHTLRSEMLCTDEIIIISLCNVKVLLLNSFSDSTR